MVHACLLSMRYKVAEHSRNYISKLQDSVPLAPLLFAGHPRSKLTCPFKSMPSDNIASYNDHSGHGLLDSKHLEISTKPQRILVVFRSAITACLRRECRTWL